MHASTRAREDYSAFHVKAWCFDPGCFPARRDLVIVEPPSGPAEVPPVKRGLVYPIKLSVRRAAGGGGSSQPPAGGTPDEDRPPPDEGHNSDDGRARRRRRRSSPPSTASAGPSSVASRAGAVPAGGARGRDASDVVHVAAEDASDPLLPAAEPHAPAAGPIPVVLAPVSVVSASRAARAPLDASVVAPVPPHPALGSSVGADALGLFCADSSGPALVVGRAPSPPVSPVRTLGSIDDWTSAVPVPSQPVSLIAGTSPGGAPLPPGSPPVGMALAGDASTPAALLSIEASPARAALLSSPADAPAAPLPACLLDGGRVADRPAKVLKTYSRKTKATAASLADAADDYINCVAVEVLPVLPTPAMPPRRSQNVPVSAPRCSRRVARLPPEFDLQGKPLACNPAVAPRVAEVDSRARASVARELGFSEDDLRAPGGADKYSNFFGNPLCGRHVSALGARMGKELPGHLPLPAVVVVSP